MLNYKIINDLANSISSNKMEFYRDIGLTPTGFRQTMEKKTMKVETLERIAAYFDKPVAYFFDVEIIPAVVQEPSGEYGNDYKSKYFDLLEKYTNCLEEKDTLMKSSNEPTKVDKKIISKSQLK